MMEMAVTTKKGQEAKEGEPVKLAYFSGQLKVS